ncbi:hypothetical protein AB0M86_47915 [Streptomyces sp. NPDC051639]|uniref:hypothetical protein n=1 Tax=Streptomyces sp. NPDC051639 TaxID=3155671 RepID=UPI003449FA3D
MEHGVLVLPDFDPAGGIAEDEAGPLGPRKQRTEGDKLFMTVTAVQGLEISEDGRFPLIVDTLIIGS